MYKFVLAFLLSVSLSFAFAHDNMHEVEWTTRYTGKKGTNCCNRHDCVQARIRMLEQNGETATFEVFHNGKIFTIDNFPLKGYHSSEDEFDWYCFVVPGSYDEFGGYVKHEHPCYINPTEQCANCLFISVKF